MLHTTTNLTLYRVLSCGESSGTVFRVPTFAVKSFRRHLMMTSEKNITESYHISYSKGVLKSFS